MESAAHLRLRGRDRRKAKRFVFWNRRSGFDRRGTRRSWAGRAVESNLVYLRDHPAVLAALLILGNLLSFVDLMLTNLALSLGAIEVNPFMAYFFEAGPTAAAVAKLSMVFAASVGMWMLRRRRIGLQVSLLFVAMYAAIVLYQIVGITTLL